MHELIDPSDPEGLKALYAPEGGMNLMSLKEGAQDIIDPATTPLYKERYAGLGALIGPHFHHRKDENIPHLPLSSLFPHIEALEKKGQKEFFSHGIARYVPWKAKGDETHLIAHLKGSDDYRGFLLKDIEGFDFELTYEAKVRKKTLHIDYRFQSERPGVIGLHYYYALHNKKGSVHSQVGPRYHHPEGWKALDKKWLSKDGKFIYHVDRNQAADFGFCPKEHHLLGSKIVLETSEQKIQIHYETDSTQNAWQLYHPKDATYVCIEPVTAHNPRDPKLMEGRLKVEIKFLKSQ